VLNRAVEAERGWRARGATPEWIARLAAVGLISYSLYLTHQLVLLESWKFEPMPMPQTLVAILVMTPLCIVFAWLFFLCFERPCLPRPSVGATRANVARHAPLTLPATREEPTAAAVVPEGAL
jgi:peptidoglycan/LPS O-acetylase OafA/YrhL